MAKETGLGANFYLDGYDLSGDTSSLENISKALNPIALTGIDKLAFERKSGQLTGRIAWTSFWNPTGAHPPLKLLPRTDRIPSYWHRPTLGAPVASMVAKQTNYDGSRTAEGGFMLKVDTLSNAFWLDWGLGLTVGKRTDTVATNGTGVDFTTSSAFGLQAYLQVFAFTGTSATIKLQESSDNGAGDAFADVTGGAFTLVTSAPQSQKIQTARALTIERYLRVVTTGTFSNLVFAVHATINRTDNTI